MPTSKKGRLRDISILLAGFMIQIVYILKVVNDIRIIPNRDFLASVSYVSTSHKIQKREFLEDECKAWKSIGI